jgi:hypothetical protein
MANKSLLKRLSFPARTSLVCINIGIIVTIFKQRSASLGGGRGESDQLII